MTSWISARKRGNRKVMDTLARVKMMLEGYRQH
nr:MAG TPA: hypothetical protein [Caudoviricetes sp.]